MRTSIRYPAMKFIKLLITLMLPLALRVPLASATPVNVLTVVPSSGFEYMDSPLQTMLEGQGFAFSSILPTTPITSALLSGADILFFQETPLSNDPLTATEAAALVQFVQTGGGVLIVGEAGPDYGPSNLASRAAPFGIGVSTVGVFGTITDFTPHPITEGLTSLIVFGGNTLTVSSSAMSIGRLPDGETGIATTELGQGRVVVTGDEVWRSHDFGNPTLTSNVFNWLAPETAQPVPEPSTLLLLGSGLAGLGGLATRGRQRK